MALKIHKVSETSSSFELGEAVWLTAERDEAVAEGDPRAAFLLGTAGKRISIDEAQRLGLAKGAKTKEAAPAADKEAKPEAVKDIVARIADMDDDELEALASDERKGVVAAREAEIARRAEASE